MEEQIKNTIKDGSRSNQCGCNCGRKKFLAIIIIVLIAILLFFLFKVNAPKSSQDMGLGEYSQEELDKMYPQIKNADVPTRTTPEQTYAALKEALKNEDVEAAVNCFFEDVREEWKDNLQRAKEENFIKQLADDLPEGITEVYTYEAIAQYKAPQIVDGHQTSHTFDFVKDNSGDWKIKSL